jgi:hypothetical protein
MGGRSKLKTLDICPLLITQLFDSAYKVLNHLQIDESKLKLFNALIRNSHSMESKAFSKSTSNNRPLNHFLLMWRGT